MKIGDGFDACVEWGQVEVKYYSMLDVYQAILYYTETRKNENRLFY